MAVCCGGDPLFAIGFLLAALVATIAAAFDSNQQKIKHGHGNYDTDAENWNPGNKANP